MSVEDSSPYPVDYDDDDLELGLGLSIGGGLKIKKEACRMLAAQDFPSLMSSCSSSSSSSCSSINIPNASIVGVKRTSVHSVSSLSVVGWPPIRRAHRVPISASHIKSEHEQFSSRAETTTTTTTTNGHHLTVKVNMDGTVIGRKVDLYAHTSYETLAQTLDNMFNGRWSSIEAVESSRLLNEASEYVLTYEDKDGDCMLVGDVPWQMFLNSVKRLRILKTSRM